MNEIGGNEAVSSEVAAEVPAQAGIHAGGERAVYVAQENPSGREALALAIAVAGWLVPGLGHALLKMWGRALACFFLPWACWWC